MKYYRYKLDKSSKKYTCPNCEKKTFVRFIDTQKNELLPDEFGRCDRESKCSYSLNPYENGYSKMIWEQENNINDYSKVNYHKPIIKKEPLPAPEIFYFDFETFKQTLKGYDKNIFIQNLLSNVPFPFNTKDVSEVVSKYRLGTVLNGYLSGAITFPYIDINSRIRAVQVRKYDKDNHGLEGGTNWLDNIIIKYYKEKNKPLPEWLENYQKNERKVSCLFGEHLLQSNPTARIGIVEAPKTAVYCSLYFKDYEPFKNIIWLAIFNKSSFTLDKLKVLKNRFVFVFPDLSKNGSTFNEWKLKAKEYETKLTDTKFIVSDFLERLAPEKDKEQGNDIADFLIQLDWKKFRTIPNYSEPQNPSLIQSKIEQPKEETLIIEQIKQIFQPYNNYYYDDVKDKVSESQMIDLLKKRIISRTGMGTFYLAESTPF